MIGSLLFKQQNNGKNHAAKIQKNFKEIMTFIKDMENFAKRLKQLIDTIEIKPAALSLSMGWVTLMTVTPFDLNCLVTIPSAPALENLSNEYTKIVLMLRWIDT